MSLLIKALENAEKDKQAELSKKRAKPTKSDTGSPLELAPVEYSNNGSQQDLLVSVGEQSEIKDVELEGLSLAVESFVDESLSLAAEAGLVPSGVIDQHKDSRQKVASTSPKKHAQVHAASQEPVVNASAGILAGTRTSSSAHSRATSPSAGSQTDVQQKAAASVFVANQAVKSSSSKTALILLGIAGALMIWLGIEGSRYLTELTTPEVMVRQPVAQLSVETTPTSNVDHAINPEAEVVGDQKAEIPQEVAVAPVPTSALDTPPNQTNDTSRLTSSENAVDASDSAVAVAQNEVVQPSPKPRKSAEVNMRAEAPVTPTSNLRRSSSQGSARSVPLQVSSRTPVAGVDPVLLSAYQAFNRGEDSNAQQQYRQVLQRDVRNVDALLGMAAIAQRQGRDADAMGWYQKVLEIEPKNTIAQSALVSPQANIDAVSAESRIKNLLVYQPDAAHLHAALGNVYAEQSQWAYAQEAYFNASRFAPNSADYAFNLAISLDQLGKSDLAIAQYERALTLLNSSGASSPDKAQLEARIQALQSTN